MRPDSQMVIKAKKLTVYDNIFLVRFQHYDNAVLSLLTEANYIFSMSLEWKFTNSSLFVDNELQQTEGSWKFPVS